jgi:cerevisin
LNIKSIWTGSPTAINVISGTSMASPHTAGALAYLLSIYPDASFNPEIAELFDLPSPSKAVVHGVDVYAFVRSALPAWIGHFLPSPTLVTMELDAAAPIPAISPAQLKKALIKLASPGLLSDVGNGSPNLLLFNNATA